MKNILRESQLIKYLDQRDQISDYREEEDQQALAEIQFTLSNSQMRIVMDCTTAHDAWEALKASHLHTSDSNRVFLLHQFLSLKMSETESMREFLSRASEMAKQLKALGTDETQVKVNDALIALVVTRGVPAPYNNVITAMQETGKSQDYAHVCNSLMNEETRLKENKGNSDSTVGEKAFYTNTRGRGSNQSNRGKSNSHPKFEGNCNYCGIYGHKEVECRKKKREQEQYRGRPRGRGQFRGHSRNQANYVQNDTQQEDHRQLFTASVLSSFAESNASEQWLMDTGATHHMTPNRQWFRNYDAFTTPIKIEMGDKGIIFAQGKGDIDVNLKVHGEAKTGTFTDVLYVPDLHKNLFSVSKATSQGLTLHLHEHGDTLSNRNNKPAMTATRQANLYLINGRTDPPLIAQQANIATDTNNFRLWHERLGHIGMENLNRMISNHSVEGLPVTKGEIRFCEDCAINKLTRISFTAQGKRATKILDLVHTDLCGPMRECTPQGNKYFITFIDDYSRKAFVYFIKAKNEAFEKFQQFKSLVENQTGQRIKTIRSDNGGEYINAPFQHFLRQHGIRHQVTAPYTPQQNGIAERFNRTVVEMGRTMLHSANLPYTFWAEAVNTATYIRNRCISRALDSSDTTPEELWSGMKPDISHLRIFGCPAYALIQPRDHKFAPKAEKCIFLGYATNSKAYRLWNNEKRKLILSRDVKFDEIRNNVINLPPKEITSPILEESRNQPQSRSDSDSETELPTNVRENRNITSNLGKYWDTPSTPRRTRTSNASNTDNANNAYAYAFIAASELVEPQSYEEAINSEDSEKWKEAMNEEYRSLIATSTTQAEYQSLSAAVKEAIWLRALLKELGFEQPHPTQIEQDNQSTIALSQNPVNHSRTKHIDIIHHHVREQVENQSILLQYQGTNEIIADIFTKALPHPKFDYCRNKLGICEY